MSGIEAPYTYISCDACRRVHPEQVPCLTGEEKEKCLALDLAVWWLGAFPYCRPGFLRDDLDEKTVNLDAAGRASQILQRILKEETT